MPEYKLTAEQKAELIGLLPFSQNATVDFIPESYKKANLDPKITPVFKQRAFTRGEHNVRRRLCTENKFDMNGICDFARKSVVGWECFYDLATEKYIDFKADEDGSADGELFEALPDIIKLQIWNNAAKISGITPRERVSLKSSPGSTQE